MGQIPFCKMGTLVSVLGVDGPELGDIYRPAVGDPFDRLSHDNICRNFEIVTSRIRSPQEATL